ncbi:protein FANTASTIC FOUR 3 [Spinacia oleracea]|uniref:Protein FANTASTIC FOUR 3 n=1 Tax=Spinacia oleracea TaxID=3562 RepID=A0A9R0IWR3_SPIOL|nr:protein FANTASTIC FOUR 3-like [Spinacia oleracea]
MATCGSLRHIFENTIVPENNHSSSSTSTSSLIDSLSPWNHIKTIKPHPDHSFTEIFGELHFKETHPNPTSSSLSSFFPPPSLSSSSSVPAAFPIDLVNSGSSVIDKQQDEKSYSSNDGYSRAPYHRKSESFSSLNSDSLQLCTEGLGSESLGDVEDLLMEVQNTKSHDDEKVLVRRHSSDCYCRKMRVNEKTMFPPPIPYIGQAGKPSVSFQSYRQDGRFVLKEVRIPTHECLQASREDGRLRLSIVQPGNDEEEEEEEEEDDEDDDDIAADDDDIVVEGDDGGEGEMDDIERIEDGVEEETQIRDGVKGGR